jgi:hypothetical protein
LHQRITEKSVTLEWMLDDQQGAALQFTV